MRLWSLHPEYLDRQGLLALWREGLLAQAVLLGKTRGYTRHPQLERFRQMSHPLKSLRYYLLVIQQNAQARGYHFSRVKLGGRIAPAPRSMPLTHGQLAYEREHLLKKLARRSPAEHEHGAGQPVFRPHPIFALRRGPVETWEKSALGILAKPR